MWKQPYKKGERPVGLNGKPHECSKRKGMVDRGDYSRFSHNRELNERARAKLPDISVPYTPTYYHCLKCNKGVEVIDGPIDSCVPCQKQRYEACKEYCPICKIHPTAVYASSEKGAIWKDFDSSQVTMLIYDPVSEAEMHELIS